MFCSSILIRACRRALVNSLALQVCLLCCVALTGYAAEGDCSTPSFNSPPSFSAGNNPNSVAAGDLNGDGVPDLAVSDYSSGTLSVLFSDGEGAFLPPVSYAVGIKLRDLVTRPRAVAIGDLNGDGKPDIAVAGDYPTGWVSVLLGDGTGKFGLTLNQETMINGPGVGIALGDFNGDGKKDIALSSGTAQKVSLLLGDGAGGFASINSLSISTGTSAIAAGDFNGDGLTDVVVTKFDGGLGGLAIINGNGAGIPVVSQTIKMRSDPKALAVADFNLDGKLDIAVSFSWADTGVELFFGDGAGGFGPPADMFTPYDAPSLSAGDFNHDGYPDLAVDSSGASAVGIFLGLGNGHFYLPRYFGTLTNEALSMVVADFNKDGNNDIVTTHYNANAVALLAGDGTGAFASPRVSDERGGRIAAADFNGDGRPDVAVPGGYSDDVQIHLNDGAGGLAGALHFPAGRMPTSVVTGDFNRDGKVDLIVGHDIYVGYITMLLGDGTGGFSAPNNININATCNIVAVGDFDNDGNPDIALLLTDGINPNKVALMRGNGAGGFGAPSYAVAKGAAWMASLDVNGDGKLDLALANAFPGSVTVLLGDGAGGLSLASYAAVQISDRVTYLRAADINKDGRPDLLALDVDAGQVAVLLNNGAGFDTARIIALSTRGPQAVTVGDFNADGNPDLAVAMNNNYAGNIAVLSGDGMGNFSEPVFFTAGGASADITTADFNGDGKPDLATPNYTAVLLNTFKPLPCLSVSDVSVTEGDAGTINAVFNVTLSAPSEQAVKVNYVTQDHTATGGSDYVPVSGRLVFAPGVTTQSVSVPIPGDTLDEFDEDFYLLLFNPANADISKARGTGTINDNDPEPGISVSDWRETEGNILDLTFKVGTFKVTLSAPSGRKVTVAYNVVDGTATAGKDYRSSNNGAGTLTFEPGETTMQVNVSLTQDATYEPDETLFLNLSNPVNATITKAQGQGTIVNDDPQPTINIQDLSISESNPNVANAFFVVRLSNPSSQPITVSYATADGTATAGSDYVASSGSILFNPEEVEKHINVPVINDTLIEPTEVFFLNLTGAVNAVINSGKAQGSILDDDTPLIGFSSSRYSVSEGAGFATITVTRGGGTSTAASVEYVTADGTAAQRTKYTTSSGTLNFAPGETSKTFIVPITDEAYTEGNQTVVLSLRNPAGGAALTTRTAVLDIIDNDMAAATANPIDDAQTFVRQHYYDFLSRVPDEGGLGYWTNQLSLCGTDPDCLNQRRIGVSAAFFIELEFQETGSVVYRLYRAAYGVRPTYDQFMPDRSQLIAGPELPASTLSLANRFVERDTFKLIYPDTMSAPDFVNRLFDTAGLTPFAGERQQEIQAMSGGRTRAEVLLDVINIKAFRDREYNPSFVLMQYFGYLRRDPDQGGYDFWLNVLNNKEPNNYRGMVCAFITSKEYQERFSPIFTRSNRDCANIR